MKDFINKRKYGLLISWGITTVILIVLAIYMFNQLYGLRSPIYRKPIVSPVSKKTAMIPTAYAQDDKASVEASVFTAQKTVVTPSPIPADPVSIIKQVWGKDSGIGLAIANCESTNRAWIVNSIGATGLFQILISAHPEVTTTQMLDPLQNAKYAYKMYQDQGTTPWNSSRGCWGVK